MRWRRDFSAFSIEVICLAVVVYLAVLSRGAPLLWPYRDHPLVRVLLAFLTGDQHPYRAS